MRNEKDYEEDVYKRLELVQKQFKANVAEQKKQKATERRQHALASLGQNKARITRLTVYVILGILVVAVVWLAVSGTLSK